MKENEVRSLKKHHPSRVVFSVRIASLLFHAFDEVCKGVRLLGGHLGEYLSVKFNILFLFEGDEGAVGDTMFTEGVIEADDPEGTEGSLLGATIPSGIDSGLDNRFFRFGEEFLSAPSEALGFLKNIVVALFGHDATLDSGHRYSVFTVDNESDGGRDVRF